MMINDRLSHKLYKKKSHEREMWWFKALCQMTIIITKRNAGTIDRLCIIKWW